jgi:uncharacterized membrane protein
VIDPDQGKQIEKVVRREKPQLLKSLPGDKKQDLIELLSRWDAGSGGKMVVQQQITSSPVPPAELLAGYNSAFPDGADRLFTLVEKQSEHRQQIEARMISHQCALASRGQWFAFGLAVIFGGIGVCFAWINQPWLAGTVFTTTIGGLVATFLLGQKKQERSLDRKTPSSTKPSAAAS